MKEVKIKPILTWHANEILNIDTLRINCSIDNLIDSCDIYYSLISSSGSVVAEKSIEISGEDYKNWDGNIDDVFNKILKKYSYEKI
jgi:hypothetical protein